jgi:hypothetical protein
VSRNADDIRLRRNVPPDPLRTRHGEQALDATTVSRDAVPLD